MIWKDVVGYENFFQISDSGQLFSKRSNKILKPQITQKGYETYSTKIGGRKGRDVFLRAHRLVAEAFVDNPENKPYVNHIDGNKTNNSKDNLEWVTAQENSNHAVGIGLMVAKKGVDNPLSAFDKDQVDYIINSYIPNSRKFGARALAKKFGVSHATISRLINTKHQYY